MTPDTGFAGDNDPLDACEIGDAAGLAPPCLRDTAPCVSPSGFQASDQNTPTRSSAAAAWKLSVASGARIRLLETDASFYGHPPGTKMFRTGSVVRVKVSGHPCTPLPFRCPLLTSPTLSVLQVLGCLAMIDDGETDWKVPSRSPPPRRSRRWPRVATSAGAPHPA